MEQIHSGSESPELAALAFAVDSYLASVREGHLSRLSAADVVAETKRFEQLRRMMASFDVAALPEWDRRSVCSSVGVKSTAEAMTEVLRVSRGEAKARCAAAGALASAIGVTGHAAPVRCPLLADAVQAGDVSGEHVGVVLAALDELPSSLPADKVAWAERIMVTAATNVDPKPLRQVGTRLLDTINPDGAQPNEAEQRRNRFLTVHPRRDGGVDGRFRLSAAAGAKLMAVLDPLAKPRPSSDGEQDSRTHGQRMADGLEDLADLGLRASELTPHGGPSATLIVTMTKEQYESGKGLAETSLGQLIPAQTALDLADEVVQTTVITSELGGVLSYGDTRRFATPSMVRALIARDRGCSFPGCDAPPEWSDRHHVIPWKDGGPTSLNNMTLVCGFHHREHERLGWKCHMNQGVPWWTPPKWKDPDQTPLRNHPPPNST